MLVSKRWRAFYVLLMISASFPGCERGVDDSITGDLFYRDGGNFKSIAVTIDSMYTFAGNVGENTEMFVGAYENATSFAVIKFPTPAEEVLDNLDKAIVKFELFDIWRDGDAEYGIYHTNDSWEDSTRIAAEDFLPYLGDPLDTVSITQSDTTGAYLDLWFTIDPEDANDLDNWTFLLRGMDGTKTMVGIGSRYSTYRPTIDFIAFNEDSEQDTTTANSSASNYHFDTGYDPDGASDLEGIISNADARSIVYTFPLPEALPATAAINKFYLRLNINEQLIPEESVMTLRFQRLTEPAVDYYNPETDTDSVIDITIQPGETTKDIDLTSYIASWHHGNEVNKGILIQSRNTSSLPNHVVISPADSLFVYYSTLPEVE